MRGGGGGWGEGDVRGTARVEDGGERRREEFG